MAAPADRGDLVRAFEAARDLDDVVAMATAATRLASQRRFGAPSSGSAGYLHTAYQRADGPLRVRLAVELARAWVYAGEAARAVPFAEEAMAGAEDLGDPTILAGALDAHLLVHWGPDDLDMRVEAAARLEEITAHLTDVEARLTASLWRLTTAVECLDVVAIQRQLALLDDLGQECGSPRVRMFAASRRGMYALLVGDADGAMRQAARVKEFGTAAAEPDTEALFHVLCSGAARQRGDVALLAEEASAYAAFATSHGVRSILAEAALLWVEAGFPERAAPALQQATAGGLASVPRDVDWLLTVATTVEAGIGIGGLDIVSQGLDLLMPYAGRGIVNAGAAAFVGVVDDYLWRACAALGRDREAANWAAAAALSYQRLNATWWLRRLPSPERAATAVVTRAVLQPGGDGVWLVGVEGRATPTREMKGFRYLRLLLERPNVALTALEMTAVIAGHHAALDQADVGEVIDRQALTAYRRRIVELDTDLAEARSWADTERTAHLLAERGMLLDEIAGATGLGGRHRVTGATAERARIAVQKSVAVAIRRICEIDASLGRLLRDTIRTGTTCCYEPDPARPVLWTPGPGAGPRG